MSYLTRLLDAGDPSASLKHAAYLMVVTCGCLWLSWAARKDLDAEWVTSFGLLLGAVTTSKIVGASASSGAGGGAVPTPTATDGAK